MNDDKWHFAGDNLRADTAAIAATLRVLADQIEQEQGEAVLTFAVGEPGFERGMEEGE